MKIKYIIIILLIIILLALILFIITNTKKNKKIEDINKLHFSYSTGYHNNASIVYELECNEECILYFKDDGKDYDDKKEYKIDKNILEVIANKLNEYQVGKWDKYNKDNPNVLDGNSFHLTIKYKNNETITATGYESWPKNYSEVKNYLTNIFSKYIDKNN